MSHDSIEARVSKVQARKRAEREQRIDRLVDSARRRGEDEDRIFWSIVHDLEEVPLTTNRAQLLEIGARVPSREAVGRLAPEAVHVMLWRLIEDLGRIHVYLCHTDHLDDRTLLHFLLARIIEEPVPDLPLSVGYRDWIDCEEVRPSTLHRDERPRRGPPGRQPASRDQRLPRPG